MLSRISRLLSTTWKTDDGTITPSEVSQKHLCEKVGQSYPCTKALELFREVESMGFGNLVETTASNKRKVLHFRKRLYSELSEECQTQLKQAKVSEDSYSSSFKMSGTTPGERSPQEAAQEE